jgi:hypothetical protein
MGQYKLKPGIESAYIPGSGRVLPGRVLTGDLQKFVPSLLTEVLPGPTATQKVLVETQPVEAAKPIEATKPVEAEPDVSVEAAAEVAIPEARTSNTEAYKPSKKRR